MKRLLLVLAMLFAISAFAFAESCSLDGYYRCVGTGIQRCVNSQWSDTLSSCPAPTICVELKGGFIIDCRIPICTLDQSRCADSTSIQFCTNQGTEWTSPEPCAPDKSCVQVTPKHAECQLPAMSCTPGTSYCKTDLLLETCNTQGNGYNEQSCGPGGVCTTLSATQAICEAGPAIICTPNNKRCNGNDVEICNLAGTAWNHLQACSNTNQICVQVSATDAQCVGSPPVICTPNNKRCNGNDVEICNLAGTAWNHLQACSNTNEICVQLSATDAQCRATTGPVGCRWNNPPCAANQVCVYDASVPTDGGTCQPIVPPVCTNGQVRCDPANSQNVQICSNNNWVLSNICNSNEVCLSGQCVQSAGCTEGTRVCVSNDIYTCVLSASTQATSWVFVSSCVSPDVCAESAGNAICLSTVPTTPTAQAAATVTSNGVGGGNSGGGSTSACTQYSDWASQGSTTYTETGSDGRTRQCTNTTLERWCVGGDGKLVYSDSQAQSKAQCGDWSEQCEYVYSKTESSNERSQNNCRTCQTQTYVYTCQPSGKTYPDNTQQKTNCSGFSACPTPLAAAPGNETAAQATGGIGGLLRDYGTVLGILVLLLLGIVAYTAWKMFGDEGTEGGENELGEDGSTVTDENSTTTSTSVERTTSLPSSTTFERTTDRVDRKI